MSEARHGSGGVRLSSISSPAAGISLPSWWWSRELQQSSGRVDLALSNYYFFYSQLLFDRLPFFSEEHKQGKEVALFFCCL